MVCVFFISATTLVAFGHLIYSSEPKQITTPTCDKKIGTAVAKEVREPN